MPKLIEEELPKILVHTGALKFGMFTLSGGKLSPYYLDLRVLPSFPDAFHASIELLGKTARTIADIAKIAGIPTGGLRSEEHTSELQSRPHLVCRLLLDKKQPRAL